MAETEYYIDKVMRLVATTQEALDRIHRDLDVLKERTVQTRIDMEGYIKEVL